MDTTIQPYGWLAERHEGSAFHMYFFFTDEKKALDFQDEQKCECNNTYTLTPVYTDVLLKAVREYSEWYKLCQECPKMLLSDGLDPEPARIIQKSEEARNTLFKLAGVK